MADTSIYEASTAGEASQRRGLPSCRALFMAIGVILVIAVIGMMAYVVVLSGASGGASAYGRKGASARAEEELTIKQEDAGESTTTEKLSRSRNVTIWRGKLSSATVRRIMPRNPAHTTQHTHKRELGDNGKKEGSETNKTTHLRHGDQHPLYGELCTLNEIITLCDANEASRMAVAFVCMESKLYKECVRWEHQLQCLGPGGNRFQALGECKSKCEGRERKNTCLPIQACSCTGKYRKVNYYFDPDDHKCTLLPDNECIPQGYGFANNQECLNACNEGTHRGKGEGRCSVGRKEELLQPCTWTDKRYRFYYDQKSRRCQQWDKGVCVPGSFKDLPACLRTCKLEHSKQS